MGEVELKPDVNKLIIHSVIFFYGDAASEALSFKITMDISDQWNAAKGKVKIKNIVYDIIFNIESIWEKELSPEIVFENTNPRNNYFRIEEYASDNISFVDAIGCNTGYFKLDNLLNNSTTAAHEYGHTIGLHHPQILDIRGKGIPGIMYPRGTIVDPNFQYDPNVEAGLKGGTMNPFTRKVLLKDIEDLHLSRLSFNEKGFAVVGDFSSVWHEADQR